MQKNATPDKAQAELMRHNGLDPREWVVARNLYYSLIIKNRISGAFKVINK